LTLKLRSQKLALALLALLAVTAAAGTFWPTEGSSGTSSIYGSPIFVLLLFLFCANVAFCT